MASLKALVIAGAMAIAANGAVFAADLGLPPPPPMPEPVVAEFGGWYLRGDIGVGITEVGSVTSTFDANFVVPGLRVDRKYITDQYFVGAGFGYAFNSWFRADITGEYRTGSRYGSILSYSNGTCLSGRCYNNYSADVTSAVFLANGYVDLGTWYGLTPFVGVGLGFTNNRVSNMVDVDHQLGGYGYAGDKSKTNFAWALMAGLGYNVSQNLKLELGYRYLNLGDVESGPIRCQNTPACGNEIQKFGLSSHDIRIGMRWMLGGPVAYAPQPLIRKF